VASDAKTVVVAFRGTEPTVPADIITDINIFSRRTREGRVHAGFHQSVSDLYELAIAEAVRQGAQDKVVWITGHSLGGAMALVFSHRVTIENKMRPDGIVTFGQPLAVDRKICQYMIDEFNQEYVRFVNQWDPITRLLPNYRHAGARVHLNGDTYSLREPQISFTALADDGQRPAEFVEDEPGLQTMTEGEFEELERQLKEQSMASNGHQGAVAALSIPILSDHSMDNYVARLRSIGARNFKRPTGASR
jgi:predicted lipase